MEILLIVVAFLALVLCLALILPKKYSITKSIIVKSDINSCFNLVGDLNRYKDWNPFYKLESNASVEIDGMPKTIGHQYTWDGNKLGVGALTIVKIEAPKMIEFELEFLKPFNSKAIDIWKFEKLPNNQTKITWNNTGDLAFPIARIMGPFISKNLNTQFETGLNNIKSFLEK